MHAPLTPRKSRAPEELLLYLPSELFAVSSPPFENWFVNHSPGKQERGSLRPAHRKRGNYIEQGVDLRYYRIGIGY